MDAASNVLPPRIGENLPAAANRLLQRLGIWQEFTVDKHKPCHARVSSWGHAEPHTEHSIANLDGPGWLLDRGLFDRRLRVAAQAKGARLVSPARVVSVTESNGKWLLRHTGGGGGTIRARLLVDAAGAASRLGESPGIRRLGTDRLVCAWTRLAQVRPAPAQTYVESTPHGWWYTAPVPGGHRVLAFHTDSDLARKHDLKSRLTDFAGTSGSLRDQLADSDWSSEEPVRMCRAGSARSPRPISPGRLSVGDASMSFDPISGQGLFHALYSGLTGGQAAVGLLEGNTAPAAAFADQLESIWRVYHARLIDSYRREQRWPDEPFWQRRLGQREPHAEGQTGQE